jgi:hypothetical protein
MNATASSDADLWLEIVRRKAGAMRYGSLQITIHDGRVTQVEATEKVRLPAGARTGEERGVPRSLSPAS